MYSLVLMMAVTTGSETAAFGRRHSCHGCSGGCYVSCGGGGCHGSSDCCGGRRGHRRHRCHGCHGCNGGCSSYGGGYGCSGSYGCHGDHGCGGGAPYMGAPGPDRPRPEGVPPPKPGKPKTTGTEETSLSAPATITVNLPADARLTVDDTATTLTSEQRVFLSPELPRDKTFFYTFKGEIVRDGEKIVTTKEVQVRGGENTQVTLKFPTKLVSN